ncbi:MAG: SpoIIE family protein phosphatase, partial [Planctomycetes bacterium]|nr:SpoIIE family protein phosphatase [Planctomycetota bacterium]
GSKDLETILVVEDDPVSRKMVQQILLKNGYQVETAQNGCEAVEQVKELPDLIVLDCMMPEMDGYEFCRYLRKTNCYADIPVIFLTAKTDTRDKVKGFHAGGTDYVTKPVCSDELLARIRTHLDLSRSRKELRRRANKSERIVEHQSGRLNQVRVGQENLMSDPSGFSELNIAVRFQPTLEAGGDFYEISHLGDDMFGFMVADVSGHDLGVAYLTGALKALTASFINETLSVSETFIMLNTSLCKFLPDGSYVSVCYVKFSFSRMSLNVINAGHPNLLVLPRGQQPNYLDLVGDVLGVFDTVRCDFQSLDVQSGDRVFLYTDGLIEEYPDSQGKRGSRIFGAKEFKEQIALRSNDPLQETVDGVVDDLVERCNGKIDDDIVLMGIEFQETHYDRNQ